MSEACAYSTASASCAVTATALYRIKPRRDVEPISDAVRRATCWPGQAPPTDVPTCSKHIQRVKDAAVIVLGVTPLSEDVKTIVLKDKEGQA